MCIDTLLRSNPKIVKLIKFVAKGEQPLNRNEPIGSASSVFDLDRVQNRNFIWILG